MWNQTNLEASCTGIMNKQPQECETAFVVNKVL